MNEQFYKAALRILYQSVSSVQHRITHSAIDETTKCIHALVCTRTVFCNEVCKAGSVEVDPWLAFAMRTPIVALSAARLLPPPVGGDAQLRDHLHVRVRGGGQVLLDAPLRLLPPVQRGAHRVAVLLPRGPAEHGVRHIELDIHFFHGRLRVSHCGFSVGSSTTSSTSWSVCCSTSTSATTRKPSAASPPSMGSPRVGSGDGSEG